MAKNRSDEEIEEEYFKARQKDPNAKPPADYQESEFVPSPQLMERIKRSMMMPCNVRGRAISMGKLLAKRRRLQEQQAKNGSKKEEGQD